MAACEPPSKKVRHEQEDLEDIFEIFHENKDDFNDLKGVVDFLEGLYCGYGVCLAKIHVCDALCKKSFSNATCEIHAYTGNQDTEGNSNPKGYAISNIFEYGFEIVESYIDAAYKIPLRKGAKNALSKLLTFWLKDIKNAEFALKAPKDMLEAEWAVRLAHHLLGRLTVSPTYLMDIYYSGKFSLLEKCPCGCSEKVQGCFGDTSLGVPTGWHGRVDILFHGVAVNISTDDPESPGGEGNQSTIEIKGSADILSSGREQMRAQTIVFSFLQLKTRPELENFLIPSIAVSRKKVAIYFYDCKNDILLETPSMDLFVGEELSRPTLFVLWLTLNFKYFCSGVSDKMKETGYTADFFKLVGGEIEKYKQDVKYPCPCPTYPDTIKLQKVENCRKREKKDVNKINNNPDLFAKKN